jgi:hypothetical protein
VVDAREIAAAFAPAPRVPRLHCAPIVYGSPREILAAIGWTLLALAVVAACWMPIILAAIWLFRRLH